MGLRVLLDHLLTGLSCRHRRLLLNGGSRGTKMVKSRSG